MKGNRRSVCKRSGVQEITSFDSSKYRKFKFCLRLHKLGAFFKCFSRSHLFVCFNSDTQRCNSLWFEMDHMRHVISKIVTLKCSLKQNLVCFILSRLPLLSLQNTHYLTPSSLGFFQLLFCGGVNFWKINLPNLFPFS